MEFSIEPLVLSDFDQLFAHPLEDDLVNVPFKPLCWPCSNETEAQARRNYYFERVRRRFLTDPSARFQKLVLRSTGEIVSLANWFFYENGYDAPDEVWKTVDILAPPGTMGERPAGLNWELYEHIVDTTKLRAEWVPNDRPVWFNMGMVTRPSFRGRGAASMLIAWGVEQATRDNCFVGLEASKQGQPVYERHGFKQIRSPLECDCKPYGIDAVFEVVLMSTSPPRQDDADQPPLS